MQDITTIRINAINQLDEAKKICFLANNNLSNSFIKLSEKEKLSIELTYIMLSLKNHLQIFESLKKSIILLISNITEKKNLLINNTNLNLEKLDNILIKMKSIIVDKSFKLLQNNIKNSLYDYINDDHVNIMKLRINELIIQLNDLLDNKIIENIIIRFQNESNYLFNEFESLNLFYKKYFIKKENEKELDNLVKNNSDLEFEIIQILKKLNLHLDNCIKYENNNNDDNENENLLIIIKNQNLTIFSLMNSLKNNCDIISQNCKDISKFITIFKDFKIKLIKCFKEIKEFSIDVLENQVQNNILKILRQLNDHLFTLNNYKNDINQFSQDFLQFIDSYYYLILEINRRNNLNLKVQNLINIFENDLKILQDDDFNKRSQFLNNNADFLPQNLIDFDIINSKFPLINLNYSLEKLPNLSKSVVEESLQRIHNNNSHHNRS
ncbi:autophagy protein 17 [Pichia californica]|uniref:Autophagy-related protein 17 n=1 Tax=Pichia californica TaxID=460514 RepID=A0A9P6WNT9_9ASCO|nr:autophagy protein 17 [[Candida] californica]